MVYPKIKNNGQQKFNQANFFIKKLDLFDASGYIVNRSETRSKGGRTMTTKLVFFKKNRDNEEVISEQELKTVFPIEDFYEIVKGCSIQQDGFLYWMEEK